MHQSSLPTLNLVFPFHYQFIKKVILSVDMIKTKWLDRFVRSQLYGWGKHVLSLELSKIKFARYNLRSSTLATTSSTSYVSALSTSYRCSLESPLTGQRTVVAEKAMENAGTPVMLLKALPRGQSIVYKGRLPVGSNILLGLAVRASSVF